MTHRRWLNVLIAFTVLLTGSATDALAQTSPDPEALKLLMAVPPDSLADTARVSNDRNVNPFEDVVSDTTIIPRLDFAGLRLADAITALARAYNLTIYIDSSVTGTISLRLDNVKLSDALMFIIKEHGLSWEKTGAIIKLYKPQPPPVPPEPLDITFANGRLSANLDGADISAVVDTLIDMTQRNIILEKGVRGNVTGKVSDLPVDKAIDVLMGANGFTVKTIDGITYIGNAEPSAQNASISRGLSVRCKDGLVGVDITQSSLAAAISMIARECGISILYQTQIEGTVTARFSDKTVEASLTSLLINTPYTFKLADGIFYIGSRDSEDMFDSKLIMLNNLTAGVVEPLIPVSLSKLVKVAVVKEHNALLVTGPLTSITRIEQFIKEVDVPAAQVLFEVLVVDYNTTEHAEFNLMANNFGSDSTRPGEIYYPNIDLNANGNDVNRSLRSLERHLNISNLGTVGPDFFVRLQMLEQEGKANLRSHPQIAALNGHTASLQIGTTQYFLLESKTIYPSDQSNVSTQTSQRFEQIQADMSLKVTPYVSPDGELTVDVKPEFNTPVGALNADTPPTINRRVLESTVRLKSGETIVLGGLIQTSNTIHIDKVPILGSIPIIGRIFQNRTSTDVQSELMIYITPHVYFGSEGSVDVDSLLIVK